MKRCNVCQKSKELQDFYKSGIKNGNQRYKPNCKLCYDTDIVVKRTRIRNLVLEELGYYCCKICGYNKSPRALHLHHLDASTKEYQISNMWSKTDQEIKKEASKCVILCANCHAEIHDGVTNL